MTLGFYYHIVVYNDNGRIFLPAYLGLFVDELAKHSEQLYYFAYTSKTLTNEQNHELKQTNIRLVDLGRKRSFPETVIFGYKLLWMYKEGAGKCDAILVRAPSPLAPYFYFRFKKLTKVNYLMVGDYMEGIKHQNFGLLKQTLINMFTHLNEYLQNKAIQHTGCLVNSVPLQNKYEKLNPGVGLVKTTTLTKEDFFERENTCNNPQNIKLLFVGRIEKAKGMDELIAAFIQLREKHIPVTLHLAGWDTVDARRYFEQLESNDLTKNVWFYHGLLAGKDLFNLYRTSDIFVLPSHHEGFPRVIWEAMANSLPVIATKVGSIPQILKNGETALLIQPKDDSSMQLAIERLIQLPELRRILINSGHKLVNDALLEVQVKNIFNFIYA